MDEPKFDDETLNGARSKYEPKDEESIKEKVLGSEGKLNDLFKSVERLKPYLEDFKTIFNMIKDWISGDYREIPFKTIAGLAGALIYVLSPLDLIADFIPLIGFLDDVAVLALAIKLAGDDISKYREWKDAQG